MVTQSLKLGFLASGNGSSAEAIVDAIRAGTLAAQARLLVSNRRDSPALAWAQAKGVPAVRIATATDAEAADLQLAQALTAAGVELVILSGYLRQLGPGTLKSYEGRILNIHPGPLPRFGGHGMYGARVHQAVIASGVAESAMVIHLVDEEYDRGPELARRSVALAPGETTESLEARIKALEPGFFVQTLQRIAEGSLLLPKA